MSRTAVTVLGYFDLCKFIFFVHLTKQLNSTETAQLVKQTATFIQHMHKFPTILSLLWNRSIKVDFKYVDWI
jgi:hypothetical protein